MRRGLRVACWLQLNFLMVNLKFIKSRKEGAARMERAGLIQVRIGGKVSISSSKSLLVVS